MADSPACSERAKAGNDLVADADRTKSLTHEVFFRDTTHGFLTWCVASIIMASILASAVSSLAHGAAQAASMASPPPSRPGAPSRLDPMAYYTDTLFRNPSAATPVPPDTMKDQF